MKRIFITVSLIFHVVLFQLAKAETITITGPGSVAISTGFNINLNISGAQSSGTKHYSVLVSCPGCTPASWNNGGGNIVIGNGQTTWSATLAGFFTSPATVGTITLTFEITDANGNANCNNTCADTDNLLVAAALPLPVELVDFHTKKAGGFADLTWITASETNNEKFQIERSNDAVQFETIGEVSGAGTSVEPHSYYFRDEHPQPGVNYYRLKQTDFDGTFEYSLIESVTFSNGNGWRLMYRSEDEVVLHFDKPVQAEAVVEIIDVSGKKMMAFSVYPESAPRLEIPVQLLISGQYFVRVINRDGATAEAFFKT